jgi:hypothetical protein
VSTAPWGKGSAATKIGATNNPLLATGTSEPQNGDGYSWLVQLLPYMEQAPLYNRMRDAVVNNQQAKFLAGPLDPAITIVGPNQPGVDKAGAFQQKVETFMCPSFPGADESKGKAGKNATPTVAGYTLPGTGAPMAIGNYCAIPSTHYNADGVGQALDTGTASGYDKNSMVYESVSGTRLKQLGGNGAIPFWQQVNNADRFHKIRGVTHAGIRDGQSNTAFFAESREEVWSSWISGYASYVVPVDPEQAGSGGAKIEKITPVAPATGPATLQWPATNTTGRTSLNIGSDIKRNGGEKAKDAIPTTNNDSALFYMKTYAHKSSNAGTNTSRWFGPSSAHSGGVVLHGYGDGHGKSVNENIDRNTYVWLCTRAGSEVLPQEN